MIDAQLQALFCTADVVHVLRQRSAALTMLPLLLSEADAVDVSGRIAADFLVPDDILEDLERRARLHRLELSS